MKMEATTGCSIYVLKIQNRFSEATGVSQRTVKRIINKMKITESGECSSITTPQRKFGNLQVTLDNSNENVIQ
jgi:hypothetical protein